MFQEGFIGGPSGGSGTGWIEVICGGMFSGKTEELLRRLGRAQIAMLRVGVFKPQLDTRYHQSQVMTHNRQGMEAIPVEKASDILGYATRYEVIGIDEGQFFDEDLPGVCYTLANEGKRVIVAALDMDYRGEPFGPIPALLARAELVTKVHAICMRCGAPASFSFRKSSQRSQALLGDQTVYEARCRRCFHQGMMQEGAPTD